MITATELLSASVPVWETCGHPKTKDNTTVCHWQGKVYERCSICNRRRAADRREALKRSRVTR